jgi:hypothetical protein
MGLFDIRDIMAEHRGKTVAIVGNGPSLVQTRAKGAKFVGVPGNDAEDIIQHTTDFSTYPNPLWTINGAWYYHPNSVLGWNMDNMKDPCMREHPQADWYYSLFEGKEGIPIITTKEWDEWPRCVKYPLEEVLIATKQAYFTETIQYMIAFAIMCDVECIEFFGCDYMLHDRQPGQRANSEWWLGYAHAKGIRIKVSPYSNLMKAMKIPPFKTGFYGYYDDEVNDEYLTSINKRISNGESFDLETFISSKNGQD